MYNRRIIEICVYTIKVVPLCPIIIISINSDNFFFKCTDFFEFLLLHRKEAVAATRELGEGAART